MARADLALLHSFCSTTLDDHLAAQAARDPGDRALALFHRCAREVPAYRDFLAQQGVDPAAIRHPVDLATVPTTSKDSYLRGHDLRDLCFSDGYESCDTVAVSSGSTGTPTYFPRSLEHEVAVAWRFEQVFRDAFRAHERRTLAVVCFPLGTWVGGMFTSACCRLLALKGYRLLVVTAGNQPPEILRAIRELGPEHDQIVLLGYPPFLKDVVDGGLRAGIDWSRVPLKLVLAGEVVSEVWRDILAERTGCDDLGSFCASLYGTADAGVLGVETPLCTAIRRFCGANAAAADAIFGRQRLPTLVQYDPVERYFEQQGDELCLTAHGGGIPLCRYAIGDSGGVWPYAALMAKLDELGFDAEPFLERARALPFVHVFGRSQHAVSFYGANVFVEIVRLGLEHAEVRDAVTGKLVMEVFENAGGDSQLRIDVELARERNGDDALRAHIAGAMRDALLTSGGEFAAYVPPARQLPEVRIWPYGHPEHFPLGVKHRYVRAIT